MDAVSHPGGSFAQGSFSRGREELIKSISDEFAIPAAYIIPYAATGSRRTRKIYTHIYIPSLRIYVCTLKSKLVPPGAVFSITALSSRTREHDASFFLALGRTLRKPSSSFLTSPPLFLVFFFLTAFPSPFQGSLRNVAEV